VTLIVDPLFGLSGIILNVEFENIFPSLLDEILSLFMIFRFSIGVGILAL
jgi:hypothetical protein